MKLVKHSYKNGRTIMDVYILRQRADGRRAQTYFEVPASSDLSRGDIARMLRMARKSMRQFIDGKSHDQ